MMFFQTNGVVFAHVSLILFIILAVFLVRLLKKQLSRILFLKKFYIPLIILLIFTSGVYWYIVSHREFLSYDESHTKFFIKAVELSNRGVYHPIGAPQGGVFYLVIMLFNFFPALKNPINFFRFLTVFNYILVVFLMFLVYLQFYRASKKKSLIPILLTLVLLFYRPLLEGIWGYYVFYSIVVVGLFLLYFVFTEAREVLKSRSSPFSEKVLYLALFFIILYLFGNHRPEFFILSFPMILYLIPPFFKEFGRSNASQRCVFIAVILFLFLFMNAGLVSWFLVEPTTRSDMGLFGPVWNKIFASGAVGIFDWVFYLMAFLLLFSKDTCLFGIIFLLYNTFIRFFTHQWDFVINPMYSMIVLFLILKSFFTSRKASAFAAFLILIVFIIISPICLIPETTLSYGDDFFGKDGSDILFLREYLSNRSYVIYERWPELFSRFVFSDSPSRFVGYSEVLDPKMSIHPWVNYSLKHIPADFFTKGDRPVRFASTHGDLSRSTFFLKDANLTFTRVFDRSMSYSLYEPHFKYLEN
jgi:hypothetical protein